MQDPRMALTTMVYDGVFERFPRLRVATIESASGWVAEWLDRLDYRYSYMGHTTQMKRPASERELSSSLLFPGLFLDYARHRRRYGDVSRLPTRAFLYGLAEGEEIEIEVAPGTRHVIGLQARAAQDADGFVTLYMTLNGQLQLIRVATPAATTRAARPQAQAGAHEIRVDVAGAGHRVEHDGKEGGQEDDVLVLRVADAEPEDAERDPGQRRDRTDELEQRIDRCAESRRPAHGQRSDRRPRGPRAQS